MDGDGYAPPPVDFQSTASTKLAYRPYEVSLPVLRLCPQKPQNPVLTKWIIMTINNTLIIKRAQPR